MSRASNSLLTGSRARAVALLHHLPLSGRVAHHGQAGWVEGEQGHGSAHLVFIPLDLLKSNPVKRMQRAATLALQQQFRAVGNNRFQLF